MEANFPSQDAWTRAKDRYIEDLTDEEKKIYFLVTPETLFYDASAAQKKYTAGSTSFAIINKLQPLREAIEQYGQALDIYSNAYPLVLSPLWGSIRVVLHIAVAFGKYFDKLVEMFVRIGDVLPRFRVYESLFPNHERLVQSLSMAYVDIIEFCSECKAVFRHGQRFAMTSFKVAFKLTWKPFERQFGEHIERFRQHRKSVEKEAGLSHMVEAADSRALIKANQQQLERHKDEDIRRRILAAIPSVDTKAKHLKLQSLRYHGTGEWLFLDHEYLNWQRAVTSSYLCCHGIPGCGKSVLASMVVKANLTSEKAKVLYYYCDYTDQRTLQTNRILGTLLKQLFNAGPIPREVTVQVKEGFEDDSISLTCNEIVSMLCSAISLNAAVTIILDGLDECEQEAKEQMIAFLERLTFLGPTVIKLFVSCREEDNILRSLTKFARVHVTPTALENDIKSFISGSVRSRIKGGQLRLRDPKLEQEIVSELVDKANGMFLWVFFQLDELCEAPSDAKIRETLSDLPDGIFETYERILSKITKRKMRYLVSKILTWIIYAQRPLKVEELQEAVGFDIDDKGWDDAKIPQEDLMMESCRSLIVRDEADSTVRFAHYTVQQYLLTKASTDRGDDPHNLVIESAPQYLGHFCVTYLNFSDFESQITLRKPPGSLEVPGILRSGGPVWIPSILGVGKSVYELAYKLSGVNPIRPAPKIDWTKHLKPRAVVKEELPVGYANQFALLQYVVEFWAFHTKYIDSDSDLCYSLRQLVCDKSLAFEFRPWGRNRHFGPYGCVSCPNTLGAKKSSFSFMSLFHYAAEIGHWPLMEPYAREYCYHERITEATLLLACRYGQDTIVEKLLQVHKFDRTSARAVNVAAASGHAKILEHLLQISEYLPSTYHSPLLEGALDLAASNGHDEAVRLLIGEYIDNGAYHAVGCIRKSAAHNALLLAASNGHELVVDTLLERGVRWVRLDHMNPGATALHYAAEHGHVSVVRVLLESLRHEDKEVASRFIDEADVYGTNALQKAVARGHLGVVDMLLENGADTYAANSPTVDISAVVLAVRRGQDGIVLALLDKGECLPDYILSIARVKYMRSASQYEDTLRRLLESDWKRFKRPLVERALSAVPTHEQDYCIRMTTLLQSTLEKIDAEAKRTEAAA